MRWSVNAVETVLSTPGKQGWTKRWLELLKADSLHLPAMPRYGFGDPKSYDIMAKAVERLHFCGAVRHGAECFNFYFPQDLDDQFLIVWDGFTDPPWRSVGEPELRDFLLARCKEGFSFPINPVWPIRDKGWYAVLEALRSSAEQKANLNAWFPPVTGVLDRIEKLHATYRDGFCPLPPPPESVPTGEEVRASRKRATSSTVRPIGPFTECWVWR